MKVLKKVSILRTQKDTAHTRAERNILEAVKVIYQFDWQAGLSSLPSSCMEHEPTKYLRYYSTCTHARRTRRGTCSHMCATFRCVRVWHFCGSTYNPRFVYPSNSSTPLPHESEPPGTCQHTSTHFPRSHLLGCRFASYSHHSGHASRKANGWWRCFAFSGYHIKNMWRRIRRLMR